MTTCTKVNYLRSAFLVHSSVQVRTKPRQRRAPCTSGLPDSCDGFDGFYLHCGFFPLPPSLWAEFEFYDFGPIGNYKSELKSTKFKFMKRNYNATPTHHAIKPTAVPRDPRHANSISDCLSGYWQVAHPPGLHWWLISWLRRLFL